jgi:phosphoglycerol transferase
VGTEKTAVAIAGDRRLIAKSVLAFAGPAVLSLLLAAWVMNLGRADLRVPFTYQCDSLMLLTWIKGMIGHPWYLCNDAIGAPGGARMHDFPMADSLHFGLIKLILLVVPNPAVAYNLYFLLGFPLTTLAALAVFRHFRLAYAPAVLGSLLYSLLPYHFFQGLGGELFLAAYYLVPLTVLIILWLYLGENLLFGGALGSGGPAPSLRRKSLVSLVICLLVASAGVYYAFFACFLLLVAGTAAAFARRQITPAANALVYVALVSAGVGVNLAPTFFYWLRHGANPEAVVRHWVGAEWYSAKTTELLLPVRGHRWHSLASWREKYDHTPLRLGNNDSCVSLGLIASAGFLVLIGQLARGLAGGRHGRLLNGLSVLNVFAILLATSGGFGTLFSLVVSSWIRVYCRLVVYIAFFSLFAVVLLLDRAWGKFAQGGLRRALFIAALALAGAAAVLDQTTPAYFVPSHVKLKSAFEADDTFVKMIEAEVPAHSLIFQMPYLPFPESGGAHRMGDYSLFRGYLHSKELRWSYGAMKGREGDLWLRQTSKLPVPKLVEALSRAGFRGIYIDRAGFEDRAADLEANLSEALACQPLVSAEGDLSFYCIGERSDEHR